MITKLINLSLCALTFNLCLAPEPVCTLQYVHQFEEGEPTIMPYGILHCKQGNAEFFVFGDGLRHDECPGEDTKFYSKPLKSEEEILQMLDRILEYQRYWVRYGDITRGGVDVKIRRMHPCLGVKIGQKWLGLEIFATWSREAVVEFLSKENIWNLVKEVSAELQDAPALTDENVLDIINLIIKHFIPYEPYRVYEPPREANPIQTAESIEELIEKCRDLQ